MVPSPWLDPGPPWFLPLDMPDVPGSVPTETLSGAPVDFMIFFYPCGSPNLGSILDVIANLRLAILVVIVVVEFELPPSLLLFFLFVPPAFVQFLF